MKHFGLLITKDDDEIIGEWFRSNARFFDEILCLDGSTSDATKMAAMAVSNAVYVHEREAAITYRTDHGLRDVAHRMLVDRHGPQGWITLCHADEFFYHDPRKCCVRAEREGFDGIVWFAVHFLPHPSELPRWKELLDVSPAERFPHYHWDYASTGLPWQEFRSYRNSQFVRWHPMRHGGTQPDGCEPVAPFHPIYRHCKVYSLNAADYETEEARALFRHHWTGVTTGRTGVPWPIRCIDDLFVASYEPYRRCDHFSGVFEQPWNIGEKYR